MQHIFYYTTPIGRLGIIADENAVTNLLFEREQAPNGVALQETPIHRAAAEQLERYFSGELTVFSVPLDPGGMGFNRAVWNALIAIPYGETRTYAQIAEAVGSPKAYRAVGLANNRNPIPIFIPCHRVIGTNAKLTGYRGGLDAKDTLLGLERNGAVSVRAN